MIEPQQKLQWGALGRGLVHAEWSHKRTPGPRAASSTALACPTTAVSTSDRMGFMIQMPSVGRTKRRMRQVLTLESATPPPAEHKAIESVILDSTDAHTHTQARAREIIYINAYTHTSADS